MNTLLDLKPQFFDEFGHILANGRLLVYVLGTTTHADLYSDHAMTLPVANPFGLSSAGWASLQLYSPSDMTVLVQSLDGYDEMDQPIYSTVKDFDVVASGASGASYSGLSVVDTIVDLRGLSDMVDGQTIAVKGYATADDSFQRVYIWDAHSVAIDDGGAVVSASAVPVGRWLLRYDEGSLDIRAFGVLAGAGDVNSQFRSACNWAFTNGVRLVIPKGVYNMAAGGTFDAYCALDVAEGVVFNRGSVESSHPAAWYHLRLHNPKTCIADTFAGANVNLTIEGDGWQSTVVPISAFAKHLKSWCKCSAKFSLAFDSGVYNFESSCSFDRWIVIDGHQASVSVTGSASVHVRDLVASVAGAMILLSECAISFDFIRSSILSGPLSKCLSLTKCELIIDSDIELGTADVPSWSAVHNPRMTVSANLASYSQVKIPSRFSCTNNALSGSLFDFGVQQLNPYWFSSNTSLVNSINVSSFEYLDLQGASLSIPLGRGLTLKNGTVYRLQDNCTLMNVTVTDRYLGNYVKATDCVFQGPMPNLTSSHLTRVNIQGTTASMGAINGHNAVWNEVVVDRQVTVVGGTARWTNVMAGSVVCVPDNDFKNFFWFGGSVLGILFNATIKSSTVDSICYNTHIQNVLDLSADVTSINGSTKKWAFMGHYNVRIGNNENGKATFGTKSFTITGVPSNIVTTGLENKVFLFNTGGTGYAAENEYVYTATATAQYYSTDDTVKGVELYASNRPLRYSNGQQLFYFHRGDNAFGSLVAGDKLWITFEVYK